MIADDRGYDDIIEGIEPPPDEKEDLEILDKDDAAVKKAKKEKQLARAANKKRFRDLVMSTEGILLNIVENSTSDKLMKGDLEKAWGRLERHWNRNTREDKVQFYTKFLHYKLENVKQRPMDWLAFMEKKRNELANTGHIMDDEMFITHLLNSQRQAEYKGAILVIKERLRSRSCDLAEVERLLEDKYLSMKYVKGWEEEEDDYALFASPAKKKGHKKQFKGQCGYWGEIGHKAANCPEKKSKKKEDSKDKSDKKEAQKPKKDSKGKGKTNMSKIKCYNCGEMGHFAQDCPKPRENANIARENEQNRKLAELMDLGDNSVCEECAMICTDAYSDEEYKEMVVYGDQGITSNFFDKDMYGDLMNTDSDEEPVVKYNVALCAQGSVSLEKKRRQLNRDIPSEDKNQLSLSHNEINRTDNEEAINKEKDTVPCPTSYDNEIESQKAWTMGMPTIDGDISMMETEELEQIEDNNKKFLYARAVHANHMIQHHMHEILERQRVVNEYQSMADRGREMILLESDQYKNDPVINQHIMQMIDTDIFWYGKTFRAILMELWKIRNGELTMKTGKELSKEETYYHNDSHTTFNDQRLYYGEEIQQDHKVTESISDESKVQKDWPRKCFQMDEKTQRISHDVLGKPG